MNIYGTKEKLAISKTFVRDLNETEWELVGGGSAGESFGCYTYTCTQTCSQTCPTATCTYTCYTYVCK